MSYEIGPRPPGEANERGGWLRPSGPVRGRRDTMNCPTCGAKILSWHGVQPPATPQEPELRRCHTLAVDMAQMLHAAVEADRLVECPTPVGCPCLMVTRHEWMFLHTQRESALRALVAQWRENGKLFRTRAIAQLATGTTKGRIAADAYDASADAHFSMADALERLLSGPQP